MKYLIIILVFCSCAGIQKKSLTDLNLENYHSKKVLLHFYAPYCFTCIPEINELKKSQSWFKDNNWEIIIIGTLDEKERIKESLKKLELPFISVIDSESKIAEKYSVTEVPSTILLNENGELLEITDTKTNQKTSHLIGARSWNSFEMLSELKKY